MNDLHSLAHETAKRINAHCWKYVQNKRTGDADAVLDMHEVEKYIRGAVMGYPASWLPIAEAPRDLVITYLYEEGVYGNCRWIEEDQVWYDDARDQTAHFFWWMPRLPEPTSKE